MLAQLNDCVGGLLHLGPNVITFRTLLHLGQLLHLGLQHPQAYLWPVRFGHNPNTAVVCQIMNKWIQFGSAKTS